MLTSTSFPGILFALISAAIWGSGDFSGGYATRRDNQYAVLTISAASGLVVLVLAALVLREPFPSLVGCLWSLAAGVAGALGIAAFYRALSGGHTASIAPTTAVITASLPVVFSLFTQGAPALTRILGFGLALAGIALVSAATGGSGGATRFEMTLSVLAGIGFGSFFICFSLVDRGRIFTPLILSRGMTLLVGVLLLKINRLPIPSFTANPVALLAGVLDAGGNMFFILARQYASLDVVSVLASLYPVSTVILAGLILKEKITPLRWAGVALCLAAIALITV